MNTLLWQWEETALRCRHRLASAMLTDSQTMSRYTIAVCADCQQAIMAVGPGWWLR